MKTLFQIRSFSHCLKFNERYLTPTVYALSTAPQRSAIGVVRITGPAVIDIFKQLTKSSNLPKHRVATVRKLYDLSSTNELGKSTLLDESLILYFQSPKSYTGEDILELHLHGGIAVINKVLETLSKLHKPEAPVRLAEPGEFSKRAFQNRRFDLTEVEGINDLIHAETETQRISALSSMKGNTYLLFNEWRDRILKNIALLTTVIDFGEDHDIDEVNTLFDNVESDVKNLMLEVKDYLKKVDRSQVLLDGIKIALIGPPNAGKSSLLNILAQDDKAIVSNIAGTTRDSMEVPLDIGGFKVVVGDTAGIRISNDVIESEGIKRARKKSLQADINLLILPADMTEIDDVFISHTQGLLKENQKKVVVLINKCDLLTDATQRSNIINHFSSIFNIPKEDFHFISCLESIGVESLVSTLSSLFKELTFTDKEDPVNVSKRVKEILLQDVIFGFEEFQKFKSMDDIVMACEGLKSSVDGIGKVTGETIGVEEILGVVFSKFCIGK